MLVRALLRRRVDARPPWCAPLAMKTKSNLLAPSWCLPVSWDPDNPHPHPLYHGRGGLKKHTKQQGFWKSTGSEQVNLHPLTKGVWVFRGVFAGGLLAPHATFAISNKAMAPGRSCLSSCTKARNPPSSSQVLPQDSRPGLRRNPLFVLSFWISVVFGQISLIVLPSRS